MFGGLIDKCKIHHFTEFQKFSHTDFSGNQENDSQNGPINGLSFMSNISNINMLDIGSRPVQLCFCKSNLPDCSYQPGTIRVTKGKRFSVQLVAVDQVNHQRRLDIQFTACDSCPIGFEKHVDEDTACKCICDSKLEPFITKCNASTELLERDGNFLHQ